MINNIFSEFSYWLVLYPVILFVLFMGLFYFLAVIRKKTVIELETLLYEKQDFKSYQLLLLSRHLKMIFTKAQIEIFRLNGWIFSGVESETNKSIAILDLMRLKPYEKLDFFQKRLTFFIEIQNEEQAKVTLDKLHDLLGTNKKPEAITILEEADRIFNVYIKKDVTLIPSLQELAEKTKNKYVQGVCWFRIAKLSHFAKQKSKVDYYLNMAKPALAGTYYEPIIEAALKDHAVLLTK